jgi:hypothetical protein
MNQSTNADDNVDDEPFNLFSHTKKNIHSNWKGTIDRNVVEAEKIHISE